MKLDVHLAPTEFGAADLDGRIAVVIDVLRATTTIVEAFAAGARGLYPVASIEDALRLANTLGRGEVLLCGERKCLPIQGFDLGNSPAEFTAESVGGRTLVMTTTNGTAALTSVAGADRVLVAAFANLEAVALELARSELSPLIVCAGRERRFALEDAVCAGELVRRLELLRPDTWELGDGGMAAAVLAAEFSALSVLFEKTDAGRDLIAAGLSHDLSLCARRDRHAVVPALHDRQITALDSAREPLAGR